MQLTRQLEVKANCLLVTFNSGVCGWSSRSCCLPGLSVLWVFLFYRSSDSLFYRRNGETGDSRGSAKGGSVRYLCFACGHTSM